ncbi:MAG: hypothetical protein ACI4EV_03220 [Lachnospiraceae bacterium]
MELFRVSKSISKAVAVIIIVTAFVCLYKIQNSEIIKTNNYEYATNYNSKMQGSLENADRVLNYSLFSDKNTFFYLNTIKYSKDIKNIIDIKVKPSNTAAIEKLMEYSFVPVLFALIMLIISIRYLMERQNGMKGIVRATANGRLGLVLKRTGIMAIICLILSIVINFIVFGILLIFYGGAMDLLNPIQSSPLFSLFPYKINILQFFYFYCLFFAISMFVVGQIVYLIMQAANMNKISYLLILSVFALEYILYLTVPASSGWCFLKYINITYVLMPGMAMMYENWGNNYFVTDVYSSTTLIILVLVVILSIANILLHIFKYEIRENKFFEKIQQLFQKILAKMNSLMLELYKILFLQFGIIVIVIFAILISDTKIMRGADYGTYNYYANQFYEKFSGVSPNPDTDAYITNLKRELAELQGDKKPFSEHKRKELQDAVAVLEGQNGYLLQLKEEKGIEGKFINPVVYNELFGERLYKNQSNINMLCIVAVILSVAGIFAYERKHNMVSIFNSCAKRRKVTCNKAIVASVVIVIIWGLSFALNWINILNIYTLKNPEMPIQSLQQFYDFGLHLNVWGYIIFCQLFRLVWLLVIGFVVFAISMFFDYAGSIALSLTLLLPHLLYILNFEELKVLSPVILLDYNRISYEVNGNAILNITYFALCCLVILEICMIRRRKIAV